MVDQSSYLHDIINIRLGVKLHNHDTDGSFITIKAVFSCTCAGKGKNHATSIQSR